jgi:RNA 3'-terminal phosphate cyclase (ATP)
MLPFLLFCGDDSGSPITATIQGGTNVRFSLSFEYFDQVLAPALERFGIKIDRKLDSRGWSLGATNLGSATFRFVPLTPGQTLKAPVWPVERGEITEIDITILVPADTIEAFKKALVFRINQVFPGVGTNYHLVEDSRHRTRVYTLLVAHTSTGLRFGCDWLYDRKATGKTPDDIATEVAEKVVAKLDAELQKGGLVDEYLQDQLVVFQALAEGSSSIPGSSEALSSERNQVDRTDEPFGDGSQHTTTARWVTSQLLPHTKWIDKGRICKGAGWKVLSSDP